MGIRIPCIINNGFKSYFAACLFLLILMDLKLSLLSVQFMSSHKQICLCVTKYSFLLCINLTCFYELSKLLINSVNQNLNYIVKLIEQKSVQGKLLGKEFHLCVRTIYVEFVSSNKYYVAITFHIIENLISQNIHNVSKNNHITFKKQFLLLVKKVRKPNRSHIDLVSQILVAI